MATAHRRIEPSNVLGNRQALCARVPSLVLLLAMSFCGLLIAATAPLRAAGTQAEYFNIAHMTNTPDAVDWAVKSGANGVEVDLRFDGRGNPDVFEHGAPCDCSCGILGVCLHLGIAPCIARSDPAGLLNHIADKSEMALVVIDSKVSTSDKLGTAGDKVVQLLDEELFAKGYRGNVIIGIAKLETMDYLEAAAATAATSPNASRYYFSVDQGGDETAAIIEGLITLEPTTSNRVYGTGISACSAAQYYDAIVLGAANLTAGTVGSVYIWTVDSQSTMEKYVDRGALGVISNHPSRFESVVKARRLTKATPGSRIPTAFSTEVVSSVAPCDCDYHPGGCSISAKAPPGLACDCSYLGGWTCGGDVVTCADPTSPYCQNPDTSIQSCIQGRGDCGGYDDVSCDCDYHSGGCTISEPAVPNTACQCKYKGAWTCGGDIVPCSDFTSPYCIDPDDSYESCLQGRGDCGGY